MAKEWAKQFYNSGVWIKEREYILQRDHYTCTEPGCNCVATEVHHIIELTPDNINDPNISLNEHNLRSLCSECHKRITKQMHSSYDVRLTRDIIFDDKGMPYVKDD